MGYRWTVIHHPGMFRAPDDDEVRGLCDFDTQTIHVNVNQPAAMRQHTWLHELMHAVLWTLGRAEAEDERFVDSVGGALAQVFATAQA